MTDQVTINMATLDPTATKSLDNVDGRKPRTSERESRDVRHRTNGNHHHHSGESDTEDSHHHSNRKPNRQHNGRKRSPSRSRTPSPAHSPTRRTRRTVDAGVSHLIPK